MIIKEVVVAVLVALVAVGNDTPLISLLITNPCGFFKQRIFDGFYTS